MQMRHLVLAFLVTAVWGFNFVVIEWGLGDMPPLLLSAARFAVAALPAVFFVKRPRLPWGALLLIAFFHLMQFNLLFLGMYAGLSAGLASLIVQLQAFFTVLLAAVWLGERPGRRQISGVLLAFAGVGLIAYGGNGATTLLGLLLTVTAGLSWAVSNILMKRAGRIDMFALFVWVAALSALPMLAVSWMIEGGEAIQQALRQLSLRGGLSIIFMAYGATLFGFGVWGHLLRQYDAGRVAPFSLLVPLFGMSSAAVLRAESLTPQQILAASLILAGLYLVVVRYESRL